MFELCFYRESLRRNLRKKYEYMENVYDYIYIEWSADQAL